MTTVAFYVDPEVGPRGVEVYWRTDRKAQVEWLAPLSGETRAPFEVDATMLFDTRDLAIAAAVQRKRELAAQVKAAAR